MKKQDHAIRNISLVSISCACEKWSWYNNYLKGKSDLELEEELYEEFQKHLNVMKK